MLKGKSSDHKTSTDVPLKKLDTNRYAVKSKMRDYEPSTIISRPWCSWT